MVRPDPSLRIRLTRGPVDETLFGLSSGFLAFGLVMIFIGGLVLTGAVALAVRE